MQKRIVVNNGKRYTVNVCGWDDGIGAGFAVGQLLLKSISDSYWYIVTSSGSYNDVSASVSQSRLDYFGTSSYYDINYPYQLIDGADGNIYAVYLQGSGSGASLVVSQSAYTGSSEGKPYLLLQNITDGNYYKTYLTASAGSIYLKVDQAMVSASWVHPIY